MKSPSAFAMPDSLQAVARFQACNALCWSPLMGLPMLLFLNSLDASATLLGIALGATPMLTVLSLFSADLPARFGYRKFVFSGWFSRTFIILGIVACAALSHAANATWLAWITASLLVLFAAIRGFFAVGLMPWFTQLVEPGIRSRFLSLEQFFIMGAVLISSLLSVAILKVLPEPWSFTLIFLLSFTAGLVAVYFLNQVPDLPIKKGEKRASSGYFAIIRQDATFRRLLVFDVVFSMATSGAGTCLVPVLKGSFAVQDSIIMAFNAVANVFVMLTLLRLGSLLDRVGSKPVLALCLTLLTVQYLSWACVLMGTLPANFVTFGLLMVVSAVSLSLYSVSEMRLVMGAVPEGGHDRYYALRSVTISLCNGVFPIVWGILIDITKGMSLSVFGLPAANLTLLYLGFSAIALACLPIIRTLKECSGGQLSPFLAKAFEHPLWRKLTALAFRKPFT